MHKPSARFQSPIATSILASIVASILALSLSAGSASAKHEKKKKDSGMEAMPDDEPVKPKGKPEAGGALVPFTVVCQTPAANVFVDGEQLGMTPMDLPVPVTPGEHSIKVTKLGFAPFIDVFTTKGKKEVKLELELVPVAGVIHVKSNVPGSRVLVDGRYVGDAPLDVEVEVGPRAVQVSKTSFVESFQNVMSVAGQELPVEVSLAELPPEKNPCRPPPPEAPRWYKKGWVWGVVAGAAVVVAGGVAGGAYLATRDPLAEADAHFVRTGLTVATW